MNIIFDTDVLIDILRNREETALQVEDALENADTLACSVVTVGEIFAGVRKGEEESTKYILDSLTKIDVGEEIAEYAGNLKRNTKSHSLFLDDCMIAASAILSDSVLFTKNAKHYPFKNLKIRVIKSKT